MTRPSHAHMYSDQGYSSVFVNWTKQVCLQTRLKWWQWWGTHDIIWNRVPDRRRSKRKWTITKCCLTVCRSIEKRHGVWAGASVAGVQWLFMQHFSDIWWCSTAVAVVAQTSYTPCLFKIDLHTVRQHLVIVHFLLLLLLSGTLFKMMSGVPHHCHHLSLVWRHTCFVQFKKTELYPWSLYICAWFGHVMALLMVFLKMHWCVLKKVKLINHDCLPILMLLYIILHIVLAYLMLYIVLAYLML